MERRSGNSEVVRQITRFAGPGGFVEREMRGNLSTPAFSAVLLQLAALLGERFLAHIHASSFSEWGALLLHEEALATVRVLEESAEATQGSVRAPLLPLLWALKLLSVGQLADIRHYTVPAGVLDEAAARAVLGRRADFSAEAVGRCRLKMEGATA